jgi:hypothetical protein
MVYHVLTEGSNEEVATGRPWYMEEVLGGYAGISGETAREWQEMSQQGLKISELVEETKGSVACVSEG